MTVSSSVTKHLRDGTGTQHQFQYEFKIFADADLEVLIRTTAGTETLQTLNTNYIVTNAGNDSGGNILFKYNTGNSGDAHYDGSTDHRPANGTKVVINRKLTLTQGTDYIENDPFSSTDHENALDRLTFIAQQLQEQIDRSIKASVGNTLTGSTFTLSATDRADKIFAFDSSGNLSITQELGTFTGNWATSTAYSVRDLVKDTSTNNIFIVNEAHTSSGSQPLTTNANSAKYTLIVDAASATTSQNAAAASATASANSATASASSASTATTKAAEASTSASNAATSLSTFQGQYHGAASSDPSSNLDTGDLYFNTSSGVKVYTGSAWEDVKPTSSEQTNINTVAGISSAVSTVSGANANISALNASGVISNIGTVAGISSNVTTVAGLNATHLSNVSGQASNIGNLGPISANITSVANIASDVTSLANSLEKTYTVTVTNPGSGNVFVLSGSNNPAIEMFRGNAYIFDQSDNSNTGHPLVFKDGSGNAWTSGVTVTGTAGSSGAKVEFEVPSDAPSSMRYYCSVHGNSMGNTITVKDSNVSLVAGSIANVNLTGGSIANVNTTAAAITNVNAVATNIANVNSFAARYRVGSTNPTSDNDAGDLFFNTTSNELVAFNGSAYQATSPSATNQSNINIVAGQITAQEDLGSIANAVSTSSGNDINTVANAIANVTALSTSANITNMAALNASGVVANIASVAGSVSNVNSVASNISGINDFAARYRVASSAPTSSLDAGDLYFNTSTNTLNYYNGSAFIAVVAGAMTSLAVDSSPSLGGNLNVNGNSIVSASNGDITIAPNGSGEINLNGTVNTDNLTIDFGSIA
jgi:hypothetical protein